MPILNATSYTILGGLSVQPNLSGYDIRKGIQQSIGYFWAESYGQIYPALKLLAAEGLIAPSKASSKGRKGRQTYVITDADALRCANGLLFLFTTSPRAMSFYSSYSLPVRRLLISQSHTFTTSTSETGVGS